MTAHLPFEPADRDFLGSLRRDLHRHPELSWQESRTQARLETALRESGIADVRRVARTGLVARVPGTSSGPTVAIRGDIDALPIAEATELEFASTVPGVMHACGHDVHAAWAVGAARLLARTPARGDVLIVLQPAEELGEGARAILDSGALDGVRAIFGGHVDRRFPVGQVVAQPGPLAAASDAFHIVFAGTGGHGARPHLATDPIVAAADLVLAVQTIASRRTDPAVPVVVTVGSVHGGQAPNVIPDRVELAGTIRTTTGAVRTFVQTELQRLAYAVAATYRVEAMVEWRHGTPPLENDATAAAWAAAAAAAVVGANSVVPLGFTNMASEDFAFYLERLPGCFLRVGAREPGGAVHDVHTPQFAADEEALFVGAAVLAGCARQASAAMLEAGA